jgi:cytidine deaminase
MTFSTSLDRPNSIKNRVPAASFKHPEEVATLRKTYGDSCLVVSVHSPRQNRRQQLAKIIADSKEDREVDRHFEAADKLIDVDDYH